MTKSLLVKRSDAISVQVEFPQLPESGKRVLVDVRYLVAPEQEFSQLRRGAEEGRRNVADPVRPEMQRKQSVHAGE